MKLKMISQTKFDFHFATAVQMKKFIGIKSNRKCLLNISLKKKKRGKKNCITKEKKGKSPLTTVRVLKRNLITFSLPLSLYKIKLLIWQCVSFFGMYESSRCKRDFDVSKANDIVRATYQCKYTILILPLSNYQNSNPTSAIHKKKTI